MTNVRKFKGHGMWLPRYRNIVSQNKSLQFEENFLAQNLHELINLNEWEDRSSAFDL